MFRSRPVEATGEDGRWVATYSFMYAQTRGITYHVGDPMSTFRRFLAMSRLTCHPPCHVGDPMSTFRRFLAMSRLTCHPPCHVGDPMSTFRRFLAMSRLTCHPPCHVGDPMSTFRRFLAMSRLTCHPPCHVGDPMSTFRRFLAMSRLTCHPPCHVGDPMSTFRRFLAMSHSFWRLRSSCTTQYQCIEIQSCATYTGGAILPMTVVCSVGAENADLAAGLVALPGKEAASKGAEVAQYCP